MRFEQGKILDRKDRIIGLGDVVAFDIPVFFGAGNNRTNMWDIYWGTANQEGIMVDFCPITQQEKVNYEYPDKSSEMLIIKRFSKPAERTAEEIGDESRGEATMLMARERDKEGEELTHDVDDGPTEEDLPKQ